MDPFLREAIKRLKDEIQQKVASVQGGVGTFADLTLLNIINQIDTPPHHDLEILRALVARRARGRFMEFTARPAASDVAPFNFMASQGLADCLSWRGKPLFKTVYD